MDDPYDRIDSALSRIYRIKTLLDRANESLRAAALSEAEAIRARTPDGLQLRTDLYWHFMEIPGELLSEVFGVPIQKLHTVILPETVPVNCFECRSTIEIVVQSRNKLTEAKARRHVCGICLEAARRAKEESERREREWLESEECKRRTLAILRSMPYPEYLRTEHWQSVRKRALEAAGYRCQVCNTTSRLNVHHRTYERRGCEIPDDLTVLCSPCHETFHRTRSLTRNG